MELKNGIKTFHAKTKKAWRAWLQKNHLKEEKVWLILYYRENKIPSVYYAEAVEEALCFGWIDSKGNKRDDKSSYLYFAKRKPKGNWSKVNKQRVEKLLLEKRMAKAGIEMVELAKQNGAWTALDNVESLTIPEDFKTALTKSKTALKNFESFPPSSKKIILLWLQSAKRPETRSKRIAETIKLAAKNIRANHYTP